MQGSPSTGSPLKERSRNGRVKQEKRITTDAALINPRKYLKQEKRISTDAAPIQLGLHELCRGESNDELRPDRSRVSVSESLMKYNMTHARRGKAVIFNHLNFDGQEDKKRYGTEKDAKRLQETLKKLEFEVDVCLDYTFTEIQRKIKKLSKENHDDCDCLFVAVLTHGKSNLLSASDSNWYAPEYIWGPFSSGMCPSLAGKPKIFIIQASRGAHIYMRGTVNENSNFLQTDSVMSSCSYRIPSMADFLIGFSCFDGSMSFRDPKKGSWYIQSLCDVLNHQYLLVDLQRMLTKVAEKVAVDFTATNTENSAFENTKQAPTILSSLTGEVFFTPKTTQTSKSFSQLHKARSPTW